MQPFKKYCEECRKEMGLHNHNLAMKHPISSQDKSECCKTDIKVIMGEAGTNHYECVSCGLPCNLSSHEKIKCPICGVKIPSPSVSEQKEGDWTKEYTLFTGDLGAYFVNNDEMRKGIHNPIKLKDFVNSLISKQIQLSLQEERQRIYNMIEDKRSWIVNEQSEIQPELKELVPGCEYSMELIKAKYLTKEIK